jgi:hypothetical protein
MMIALFVYIAMGLVLGGVAAYVEVTDKPTDLECADGRGTFKNPKYSAIGIGLFVAVFWPILLISVAM